MTDPYLARRLEKALAEDERTGELGVHVTATADRLVAHGEVASEDRRRVVLQVLHEHEPGLMVTDQLTISADAVQPPGGHEPIDGHT